jgi:hypothetical protein
MPTVTSSHTSTRWWQASRPCSRSTGSPRRPPLISTAAAATNLLKVGEFEDRLAHLEAALGRRDADPADDPLDLP